MQIVVLLFFSKFLLLENALAQLPFQQLPAITEVFNDANSKKIAFTNGTSGSLYIFTSEHCPYDLDWREQISTEAKFAQAKKFNVYLINSHSIKTFEQNSPKAMRQANEKDFLNLIYLQDKAQALAKTFKVLRTPSAYLFDSKGHLVFYGKISSVPDKESPENYLHQAIVATLDSKLPEVQQTNILGCLIEKGE